MRESWVASELTDRVILKVVRKLAAGKAPNVRPRLFGTTPINLSVVGTATPPHSRTCGARLDDLVQLKILKSHCGAGSAGIADMCS
ncbi:hypothetical protein CUJ84_pRLN3000199 (plasmid) [Rhizobium leguminosarum]|uniref:Uncharacterized protein n=1 Tax=Rhizobium leguminosarum TaxID=384 RepID=A0A2K9ZGI4_RHILE|nr:hypothetical protein CUJ84_pRLN3000199 [Rhizobium leguminosarum]